MLSVGYKLPLLSIPESCVLPNNTSAIDNCRFFLEALRDLLTNQCVSAVSIQPWVVNPLSVSVRDDGKKRLVLDPRHANPHLSTEAVLSVIKEGYKLPLLSIPESCVLPNNYDGHR